MPLAFGSCLWLCLYPVAALAAQGPSDNSLVSNPVFQQNCAKCHGKTAEGRRFGGPSLKSEKVANASTDDLRVVIGQGKGRMPKYGEKLTSAEINMLAQQIKALK